MKLRGVGLIELIISSGIFAVSMTLLVALFVTGQRVYSGSSAKLQALRDAHSGITRLLQDIQESSAQGIRINSSHDAILLISARDRNNSFSFYAGANQAYVGRPDWQKWVIYYLQSKGTGSSYLVRKEGNPFASALPADPPVIPDPGTAWEYLFRSAPLPTGVIASDVETLDIQDINCGTATFPLYIKMVAAQNWGGQTTRFNPGGQVSFTCSGGTGNWVQVMPRN